MFFDSLSGLLRLVIVGTIAYVALIHFLRISDKRTLTKLNAFDLVITVALGSTFSSMILTKSVALFEGGVLALARLITLQYLITWLAVRSKQFQQLINAEPTLLLHRGDFVRSALQCQRVTTDDVFAASERQKLATSRTLLSLAWRPTGLSAWFEIHHREAAALPMSKKFLGRPVCRGKRVVGKKPVENLPVRHA